MQLVAWPTTDTPRVDDSGFRLVHFSLSLPAPSPLVAVIFLRHLTTVARVALSSVVSRHSHAGRECLCARSTRHRHRRSVAPAAAARGRPRTGGRADGRELVQDRDDVVPTGRANIPRAAGRTRHRILCVDHVAGGSLARGSRCVCVNLYCDLQEYRRNDCTYIAC